MSMFEIFLLNKIYFSGESYGKSEGNRIGSSSTLPSAAQRAHAKKIYETDIIWCWYFLLGK